MKDELMYEEGDICYCVNCGNAVSKQWKYCRNCGAPTDVNRLVLTATANRRVQEEQRSRKTKPKPKASGLVVLVVVLSAVLCLEVFYTISKNEPSANGVAATHPPATVRIITTPAPKYKHVFIQNGDLLSWPSYERTCPLTVSVPAGKNNYYIYLRYLHAPAYSAEPRTPTTDGYGASNGKTDDLSFYVQAGKSVRLDVPIGVYKLSYACGETWYGATDLFGDDTLYYSSSDTLSFYADGEYYNGHTLELWLQQGGNFDRRTISASQFPA